MPKHRTFSVLMTLLSMQKKSTFSIIFVLMWATLCVNNGNIESTWIINSHPK